jgi:hypothetical protein
VKTPVDGVPAPILVLLIDELVMVAFVTAMLGMLFAVRVINVVYDAPSTS